MTPQTPSSRVHAHRTRRTTMFVVSAALLGSVPLVAQALESEPVEPVMAAPTVSVLPPQDASFDAPANVPAANVPAPLADAAPRPPEPALTPEELALEAAIEVVTDTYEWDEQGPRVEALQATLGIAVDGSYAVATQSAHRVALEQAGFPTDGLPVPVLPPGPSAEQWAALRDCESGGDYSITNPSGKYRGAYQFDRPTWNSVAGRHFPHLVGADPAAASVADQDGMALALYSERSHRPWPNCGRHLR